MCHFLKIARYGPGDAVFSYRDAPVAAYILLSGRAEVMGPDNYALALIAQGNIFGDVGCMKNETR